MRQETTNAPSNETDLSFGPFRIEAVKRLWRSNQEVRIRSRPLALLRYLAERPQHLVTKEELLKRLWPGIYVTKTVLKVCVREIRQALGDDATTPKFVETIGTQGYRFIAPLITSPPVPGSRFQVPGLQSGEESPQLGTGNLKLETLFVGRGQELAVLQASFAQAQRGERQIIFVSGEAGIGKTTLVNRFLDQVQRGPVRIGQGHCIEQHGAGEAYLPVLEALGQLCRSLGREQVITALRRYAPMWLVQLPGLLEAGEQEALQRQVHGSSRDRMLREFVEALDVLAAERGVILALEDLHWSDISTLELLAYIAQRRGSARLLVIGTYRSSEIVARGHSLRRLVQELHAHGQCQEIALELLAEQEVEEYLERRFPKSPAVHALSTVIYSRTDGNALFTVSFVDYLLQHGHVVQVEGRWEVRAEAATIWGLMPKTVQRLIAKQLEERSKEEQGLLEVASVGGMSFTAAEVAAVTGRALEDVEEIYEGLASREQFVEVQGINEWPDQTLTARYRFRHALSQHVLYERIGEVQRVRLHRQLGEWLAAAYGEHAREIAGELAVHFEEGRDAWRAVRYRQQAGESALRRNAYTEAQEHLTQGLTLLLTLPETQERKQQELRLRIPLGAVLLATHGLVANELEQNLQRARELCREKGETIDLVPVLASLARLYMVRADRAATEELMEQERSLVARLDETASLIQLHTHLGTAETVRGAHARAGEHHTQVLKLYNLTAHAALSFSFGADPVVIALGISGLSLWLSGWPEQGWGRAERGIARAQELEHPFSLAGVLAYAGWVRQFRGELAQAWALTQTLVALERERGFAPDATRGTIEQGRVLIQRGEITEGVKLFTEGLAQYRATGSRVLLPYFLSFLADAYRQQGKIEEGLTVIAEAIHLTETTFDRFWAAEVYRQKGELTLAQSSVQRLESGVQASQKSKGKRQKKLSVLSSQLLVPSPQPLTPNTQLEAEACFHKAIEIARRQGAKSLELRAVMSLARLWRSQGKTAEARQMLAEIYEWFTEGFDTKDLQEAKALLAKLT